MDLELLIKLVRGRECLYALSHKKYSDHVLKESCWNEVSNHCQITVRKLFKHISNSTR